jgi:hypothetical protein
MPMLLLAIDTYKLWNIDADDESIEVVHQILGGGTWYRKFPSLWGDLFEYVPTQAHFSMSIMRSSNWPSFSNYVDFFQVINLDNNQQTTYQTLWTSVILVQCVFLHISTSNYTSNRDLISNMRPSIKSFHQSTSINCFTT